MYIQYLNFATLLIGVFAFIDFVLRFKRPLNFKIYYTIFLFSLLTLDFLIWLRLPFFDIVQLSPLINFGIWCTGLYTLSILTTGKIENWIWWSSAFVFALNIYNYIFLMGLKHELTKDFSVFSMQLHKNFLFINITRFIQRSIILISIVLLYRKIRKNRVENNVYQKKLINWIGIFIGFVMIAVITNTLITYFFSELFFKSDNFFIIYSLICLIIFVLTIYRPSFINHQNINKIDFKRLATADELKLNDTNFFYPFFNQQYFLNKEATIEDFCKKNNIEERDSFNEYIINNYNMSFNNLVNKNRVEYFVYLTKESKYKNFSIEALAKEAGFSSRTALYKPFKKFHGGTPIDLIDSISH